MNWFLLLQKGRSVGEWFFMCGNTLKLCHISYNYGSVVISMLYWTFPVYTIIYFTVCAFWIQSCTKAINYTIEFIVSSISLFMLLDLFSSQQLLSKCIPDFISSDWGKKSQESMNIQLYYSFIVQKDRTNGWTFIIIKYMWITNDFDMWFYTQSYWSFKRKKNRKRNASLTIALVAKPI